MQNKLMLIIIIVLLVVLIAAVAGFTFFFMSASKKEESATSTNTPPPVVQLTQDQITYLDLEEIRTNLSTGADGKDHVVVVTLSIGVNNTEKKLSPEILTLLEGREKVARSVALSVIRKKTFQELKRPDGQEILEDEIAAKLQEEFNSNLIVNVVISEMLYQ